MPFKGEMFLAWKYLKPQKSLLSLLTYTSILGPLLGVAVLIVVMSIMNGMPRAFVESLKEYNPHITIETPKPLEFAEDLVLYIEKEYKVKASPVTTLKAFVQKGKNIQPFLCKGIYPPMDSRYRDTINKFGYESKMTKELQPDEVLLSINSGLSDRYNIGDKLIFHSPARYKEAIKSQVDGKMKRINMNSAKEFKIAGFYNVKYLKVDKKFIVMHQDSANEMLSLDWGAATAIEINLNDPMMADSIIEKMKNDPKLKDNKFIPWQDKSDGIFKRIKQEKLQMSFVLFLIMGAAGVGIGACIFSLVVQKTKEIGILKSTGVSPFSVIMIFLSQGLFIGVLGSSLGFLTGITILKYRTEIAGFLGKFDEGLSRLQRVPMYLDPSDINLILWGAIGICLIASIVPAVIAASINPVKALQGGS
ncbi:MAG: FtsX-like permease family protein [Lentisphaeraceae bacterium]|nr:FtsX-like permease family protein [Lentisphaeraceae bacterium]